MVVCADGQVCSVLNLRTGRCEPAEGVPVRLGAHRFIAELAWAGVVALSSEEQLRAEYTPMATEPEPGTLTASAVWSQFGNPERVGVGFDGAQRVIAQRLADPSTFTDGDVQLLAAAAHTLLVRDLLWCEITERTAREYQELWRRVAVRCPAVLAAPALTLSGFAAWLTGSAVVAGVAIEQAALCDPTHRMTQLVSQMLQGGLSPQVWLQTHAQTRTQLQLVPHLLAALQRARVDDRRECLSWVEPSHSLGAGGVARTAGAWFGAVARRLAPVFCSGCRCTTAVIGC